MASRRQFLKDASLASAAMLVASGSFGNIFVAKKKKVIIIGAGFAGLSAAYKLHQRNIDFEIIESAKEVGGRVFSHTIDQKENLVIELGAEWIGEDHPMIIDMCKSFDLTLENNQFDTRFIYKNTYYDQLQKAVTPEWNKTFDELIAAYKNLPDKEKARLGEELDKMDWWRYLVNNGCSGIDLDIRELADSTDFGESIRHVSAYSALDEYAKSSPKSRNEMDYKIKGGNQLLAHKLASLFKDKIRLGTFAEKVVQDSKVKVYCSGDYVAEGDKLICTAPTLAVKKIDWQPALPESMITAIDALQYARINKNALLFSERFWKEESFDLLTDTPAHYFYHATKNQSSKKGVLISYTIGDKAAVIANQTDDWKSAMIQQALQPAFPNTRSLIEKQANYYWGNDARSLGAYAFYGKGQWSRIYPKLAQPYKHTFFAGEHLSVNWQGFMEGAIETGFAAAANI